MYKKAAQLKLRFNYRGVCQVEDLWDLGVSELDFIYGRLRSVQREQEEDSLIPNKKGSKEREILSLQIDIIRDIVQTKIEERDAQKKTKEKMELKRRLTDILARKQEATLEGKSEEEILKMIEEL